MRTVQLIEHLSGQFQHLVLSLDNQLSATRHLSSQDLVRVIPSPRPAGGLRSIARLRRVLRSVLPDLVLSYNWGAFDAVLATCSLGIPLIHHEDGFNADEAKRLKTRRNIARRLVLPRVRRVVVPSRHLLEIATKTWHLDPSHVELIGNGVDLKHFTPAGADPKVRSGLSIPTEAIVAGTVSHLTPVKNLGLMIDAVSKLRPTLDLHLLIVGKGPLESSLRSRAKRLGLEGHVHLVGHQSDVVGYLRAMDVYCISSISEQMPISLLEAMSCGLPVISTSVGDIARILPPEQREYVVRLSDTMSDEFASHLAELGRDRQRRARLGKFNRAEVERSHSFEATKNSYLQIYTAVLNE